MKKTLWMLEYPQGKSMLLVPLYAVSHDDARRKAFEWAQEEGVPHTEPALRHFPNGFTVVLSRLPGCIEEHEAVHGEIVGE
jgi:hypothetical protein